MAARLPWGNAVEEVPDDLTLLETSDDAIVPVVQRDAKVPALSVAAMLGEGFMLD
jgi:hypothetical protein